jgi:hypothetical protein
VAQVAQVHLKPAVVLVDLEPHLVFLLLRGLL